MSIRCEPTKLHRLRVTGKDRIRFLHSFCTNEIKSLPDHSAIEAFFCDVKARILGHGYVLNLGGHCEIWMFTGECERLRKHLSKYVITEDVLVESVGEGLRTVAVIGDSDSARTMPACEQISSSHEQACDVILKLCWNGRDIDLVSSSRETIDQIVSQRYSEATDGPPERFAELRIRERFPLIGTDLTDEHLAPEAGRNETAISYNKGCYLGQEPIARIDAMGHVNRILQAVQIPIQASEIQSSPITTDDKAQVGTITSTANISDNSTLALAVLRRSALLQALTIVIGSQRVAVTLIAE